MTRLTDAFKNKKAFIPFVTAGDPDLSTTEALIYAMEEAGPVSLSWESLSVIPLRKGL